jgi:5-dehydro-2-deoxygluconokinase
LDVWVLGRVGYDLYAVEHNRPLAEVEHFSRDLGGSSANIAVGLARLGLKVGIISAIGKDALADYLLAFLRAEDVDRRFVAQVSGYNTSLCLTEVRPPDRFNQVFYRSRPADTQVEVTGEALACIRNAKMLVTNGTSLAQSPARESALLALKTAKEAGVRTAFDVDYRESSWRSAADAGKQAREGLQWTDIVLANEDELAILAGTQDRREQVRTVLSTGPTLLVSKLGVRGVEAHTAEGSVRAEPCPGKLICAIGGGDGFAAGFLYALFRELELPLALAYGNAAAAIVVSRVSCAPAMPRLQEVEQRLKAPIYGHPAEIQ